jgi:hypothetical protein
MRLRSAAVTAVFNKSLVLSAAALSRRTTGEISNLMSVDSTRLQDLTPYGHAIWYSLYQIVIAMALLWGQLGPACLAGAHFSPSLGPCHSRDLNHFPRVLLLLFYGFLLDHHHAYLPDPVFLFCVCVAGCAAIVLSIPMTSMVSRHLKTLQKALSKMRDDRVKVTNEVLAGMKVSGFSIKSGTAL